MRCGRSIGKRKRFHRPRLDSKTREAILRQDIEEVGRLAKEYVVFYEEAQKADKLIERFRKFVNVASQAELFLAA